MAGGLISGLRRDWTMGSGQRRPRQPGAAHGEWTWNFGSSEFRTLTGFNPNTDGGKRAREAQKCDMHKPEQNKAKFCSYFYAIKN